MPDEAEALQEAVARLHQCQPRLREVVPVTETFKGQTAWEGTVHVFDLDGHPTASRCYAWSAPVEGSANKRFYAVHHQPPVVTPADAVRAAIVADNRKS